MMTKFLRNTTRFFLIFSFLLTSSLALDKFFIGVNVGESIPRAKLSRKFIIDTRDQSSMGDKSFQGGIFVGYNYLIPETPLFIGIELGTNFHRISMTQEENTFPPFVNYLTTVKSNVSATGAFKFGFVIKDLLFYIKGGAGWTKWSLTFSDKSNPNKWKNNRKSYRKFGYHGGAGIDYAINKNWLMGIDYNRTSYPGLNLLTHVGNFKVDPTVHASTLRLIYSF